MANSSSGNSSPAPVPVVRGVYVNAVPCSDVSTPIIANTGIAKQNASSSSLIFDNYYDNYHAETNAQQQQQQQQRPRQQQHRCNDFLFAIMFLVHLVVMVGVVSFYAPKMYLEVAASTSNNNNNNNSSGRNLITTSLLLKDGADKHELKTISHFHKVDDQVVNSEYVGDSTGNEENDVNSLESWLDRMVMVAAVTFSSNNNHDDNDQPYSNSHHRHTQQQQQQEVDESYDSITGTDDLADLILLLSVSALLSLVLSTGTLTFMISYAESVIKFALLFNIVATAVFAVGSLFLSPFASLMGLFLFIMTVYYAYVVWGRIPFAASNLVTASTAVRFHLCGLATLAYTSLFFMTGWTLWWTATFVSTVYVTSGCDGSGNCAGETSIWLVFALLISYYWTFQVIKNVVHVTVAGTVGTWWFVPEIDATAEADEGVEKSLSSAAASRCCCCSRAVGGSYLRSMTTSFGSICMGSLLVAIVEAAKSTVRSLRESDDGGGIFLCLAECLLACLQDVLEYFNMWAFVFVGLYGYPFIDSGKSVLDLFKSRGWTTIITDQLAEGALGLVSVAVGLITGLVALGIAAGRGMVFGDEIGASAAAFFIGFLTGSVLTSTLLTLVSSAVSTVIVCYAEAPAEFERKHPKLSQDMHFAWKQAWPNDFHY